jgi:hypothetical protein
VIIAILSLILILILSYFSYKIFTETHETSILKSTIHISSTNAKVSKYAIYGVHLNIFGKLKTDDSNISKNSVYNLIMIDDNNNEIRDPFEIGKELRGYLDCRPPVPNGINIEGVNIINCLHVPQS